MIQKFVIELKLAQTEDAKQVQKQVVALIKTKISEKIEQIIKEVDPPFTVFIPKIEISLGYISGSNFLMKFLNSFLKQFKKELLQQISDAQNKTINFSFTTRSELKYFNEFDDLSQIANADFFALKKVLLLGYLPWWFTEEDFDLQRVIMKYLRKSPAEFQRFLFSNNPNEDKIKKLRILNLLTTKNFITFFEKIVLLPNFKKNTAPYYLYHTILKQDRTQAKKLLSKIFVEFTAVANQKQANDFVKLVLKSSNVLTTKEKSNLFLLLQETLKDKDFPDKSEIISEVINSLHIYEDRTQAKKLLSKIFVEFPAVANQKQANDFVKLVLKSSNVLTTKEKSNLFLLLQETLKNKDFPNKSEIISKVINGLHIYEDRKPILQKKENNSKAISTHYTVLLSKYLTLNHKVTSSNLVKLNYLITSILGHFSLEFTEKLTNQYKLLTPKNTKEIFREFNKIGNILNKIDIELIPENSTREAIVEDIKRAKKIIQLEKIQLENAEKIKRQIDKIPAQGLIFEQQITTNKQLSLALFSYDFIFNLISTFFITGIMPLYAEKLYRAVKTAKKLKTDYDLVTFLILFLNKKFSATFVKDFITLTTNIQFGFDIFTKFPPLLLTKILEICFQATLSNFIKLNNRLSVFLQAHLSYNNIPYFLIEFYLSNYNFVLKSLKSTDFEIIIETQLNTILDSYNKIDNQKLSENFADFITSGILKSDIAKSSSIDFAKLFIHENLTFFQTLFAKEHNRATFIYLFSEQTIISFFKVFFKEQFIFINSIWQELNLLVSKTKISNLQKKEFFNILYISLLELISAKKRASENELLQRFFQVFKSFVQRFIKNISANDFFETIKNQIVSARIPLYKNFQPQIGAVSIQNNYTKDALFANSQIYFSHLLFFLEKGSLHWSCPFTRTEISTFIINTKSIPDEIKIKLFNLLQTTFALKRLFSLLTKPSIIQFLYLLNSHESIDIQTIISESKLENQQELTLLFPELDKEDLFEEIMKQKIDWINEPIEQDKIYVKNTGLVILCNFLSFLFKRTKLIERKGKKHDFVDSNAKQRAVHLLQYLVYGKKKYKEQNLVLNKIICGMELRMPIDMSIELTENEINEAQLLLKSVISHWKILGTISFEGFREAFLQRNGMITLKNKTYSIKAEQKAIDYLLTKIPWTFQTIKLSWTDYLISVDWNA